MSGGDRSIDTGVAVRAGLIQLVAVAVLSIALAIAFPHSFFDDWGWLVGPGAWIACSVLTASALGLPIPRALLGAALAGIPSLIAVLIGAHWLGAALAVLAFGAWCGWIAVQTAGPSRAAT